MDVRSTSGTHSWPNCPIGYSAEYDDRRCQTADLLSITWVRVIISLGAHIQGTNLANGLEPPIAAAHLLGPVLSEWMGDEQ